jgi:hypothetical protein
MTADKPVARPLPTQDNTNTEESHTDIHVLSGIRTDDPNVGVDEDSSFLRPRGHRDRLSCCLGHSVFPSSLTHNVQSALPFYHIDTPQGVESCFVCCTGSRFGRPQQFWG